jgi:hypothetical protein
MYTDFAIRNEASHVAAGLPSDTVFSIDCGASFDRFDFAWSRTIGSDVRMEADKRYGPLGKNPVDFWDLDTAASGRGLSRCAFELAYSIFDNAEKSFDGNVTFFSDGITLGLTLAVNPANGRLVLFVLPGEDNAHDAAGLALEEIQHFFAVHRLTTSPTVADICLP